VIFENNQSAAGAQRRDYIQPSLASVPSSRLQDRCFFLWKCVDDVTPAYFQVSCASMQNVEGRPQLRSATTGPIQLSDVQPQTVQQSFACVLWVHRMGHRTDDTERENSLSLEVERKLKMQARFRTASLSD